VHAVVGSCVPGICDLARFGFLFPGVFGGGQQADRSRQVPFARPLQLGDDLDM
jgi:hypothetical protein